MDRAGASVSGRRRFDSSSARILLHIFSRAGKCFLEGFRRRKLNVLGGTTYGEFNKVTLDILPLRHHVVGRRNQDKLLPNETELNPTHLQRISRGPKGPVARVAY